MLRKIEWQLVCVTELFACALPSLPLEQIRLQRLERTAMGNIEVAAFERLAELVPQTDLPQRPIDLPGDRTHVGLPRWGNEVERGIVVDAALAVAIALSQARLSLAPEVMRSRLPGRKVIDQ
jgi:hypothetical protein